MDESSVHCRNRGNYRLDMPLEFADILGGELRDAPVAHLDRAPAF